MGNKTELTLVEPETNTAAVESCCMSGFKIVRMLDGEKIEIELTAVELSDAYDRQESAYYASYVEKALGELYVDDEILKGYAADEIIANEEVMCQITDAFTTNKNKLYMDCGDAVYNAIREEVAKAVQDGHLIHVHDKG